MADGNLFATPVYADDPQAPSSAQSAPPPAQGAPAQATPNQPQNLFAQPVYDPNDHGPYTPPTIDNTPTAADKVGDFLLGAGQKMGLVGDELSDLAASGAQAAAAAVDKVRAAVSGSSTAEQRREGTSAEQWVEKNLYTPESEKQALEAGGPLSQRLGGMAGSTLSYIAEAVITPGPAKLAEGGRIAQAAYGGIKMQAPAISHAVEVGRDVYQRTGDPKAALTAAFGAWGSLTAMGAVPASMEGGIATRAATGAGIGAGTAEAQRRIENATLPADMQQPFNTTDTLLSAAQGAIFGAAFGGRGPVHEAPHGPIEAAAAHSAAIVAKDGGDALDQVVAATHASNVVGSHHDAAAYESAQQVARAQMAQEAAQERQEAEPTPPADTGAAAPEPGEAAADSGAEAAQARAAAPPEPEITPDDVAKQQAFQQAEQDQAAQRSSQEREAYRQREQQNAEQGAALARGGGEETVPTLGDTLTPEQQQALRALSQKRMAEVNAPKQPTAEPAVPAAGSATEAAANAPQGAPGAKTPQDITLIRPKADGEPWQIAVKGKPFLTYENEKAAKTRLMQMRRDLAAPPEPPATPKPVTAAPAAPEPRGELPPGAPIKFVPKEELVAAKEASGKPFKTIGAPVEPAAAPPAPAPEPQAAQLEAAAHEAATSPLNEKPMPSTAQQNAGNFQMGHTEVQGIPISIEHPEGATRPSGQTVKGAHYGYVKGTVDADGMHTDVLVGKNPESTQAFVVDHLDQNGEYQQHKVLMGFKNRLAAMRAYRSLFPDNPMGPVTEMDTGQLKEWLSKGDTSEPLQPREINRMRGKQAVNFSTAGEDHLGMGDLQALAARQPQAEDEGAQLENNASGESAASAEAISRYRQEQALGQDRYLVNPEGRATPLTGPISVDAKAPPGHIIVQRGVGIGTHTILDRGGLPALHARGLLNRAQAMGELPEPKAAPAFREGAPQTEPGTEQQGEPAAPITRLQAIRHLGPMIKQIGGDKLFVHDRPDSPTVPEDVRARMNESAEHQSVSLNNVRGMYDPTTDSVHIFAGAHTDPERLRRTAVHEIVGHKGLRSLLGTDWVSTLHDMWGTVKNDPWMKDYMVQHQLDPKSYVDQVHAADEYAAHIAETTDENPGLVQKLIDTVRSGLRKLGLVHEWSDNDIRALIRNSRTNLEQVSAIARAGRAAKGDWVRFAQDEHPEDIEGLPDDHPLATAYKFGATMEQQANYNKGYVGSRESWLRSNAQKALGKIADLGPKTIQPRLAWIGLRNLQDFIGRDVMPSMHAYVNTHDQMEGRRGQLMKDGVDIARPWSRYRMLHGKNEQQLSELMHASTLLGVDPSKPYEPQFAEPATEDEKAAEAHNRRGWRLMKGYYDKFDPQGQKLFQQVRDFYGAQRANVFQALEQRINEAQADGNIKRQAITELRKRFESGKVRGAYFPLARFGNYWGSAKDEDGNVVSFSRFESPAQQKAWIDNMKGHGLNVDGGTKMDDAAIIQRIDPQFVDKVTRLAEQVSPDLADEIHQLYLRTLPEMSARKHFIHRQGRLGFTGDALRAFAYNAFHGAHQQARLEFGNRMDGLLQKIQDEARGVEQQDPTSNNARWAAALANEMRLRHEWIRNPKASSWASALTKFGFGWYLGAAPATAFRIFSQNPMIAQPMLAKHFGQIGASRELLRASGKWAITRGDLGDTLRGNERRAFDEANNQGIFSNTYTQELATGGTGQPTVGPMAETMKALGLMFNAMEHHNRQTTFLAAYRLGAKKGMAHDDAFNLAKQLTWDSHFDYTNANRPRVLQNDFAKVIGLFKQYSWNVTYRIAREFRDMTAKQSDPEKRAMATKAFAGLMGRQMMFGGVTGLPLYWIAETVMNHVLGDKDKPFDMTAALHKHLNDQFGSTVGDSIMTGPAGALSGASLHGGASYNDLWYRPPDRDLTAPEYASDALGQFLGAIPAIATNAATGVQQMADGNIERGFEHFMPPEAAALMKTLRYAREGVNNLQGEPIVPRDQLTNKDLFLQSVGFTPQKVADQYARNTANKNYATEVQARRSYLMNRLQLAWKMGDEREATSVMRDVSQFDKEHPGMALSGRGLKAAIMARYRNAAETQNGLKMPRGLEAPY